MFANCDTLVLNSIKIVSITGQAVITKFLFTYVQAQAGYNCWSDAYKVKLT